MSMGCVPGLLERSRGLTSAHPGASAAGTQQRLQLQRQHARVGAPHRQPAAHQGDRRIALRQRRHRAHGAQPQCFDITVAAVVVTRG